MYLAQKSKFNEEASKILIEKSLYAPSVHCSYYATFQLIKVALNSFMGIRYDDIDLYVASNKTSEHSYVRIQLLNFIRNNDSTNYRNIERKVKDLFQYRVEADYKNKEVDISQANKARAFSREIILYLKANFHV